VWVVDSDNKKITMSNGKVLFRKAAGSVADIVDLNFKLSNLDADEDE
jgi:hypothetical protein